MISRYSRAKSCSSEREYVLTGKTFHGFSRWKTDHSDSGSKNSGLEMIVVSGLNKSYIHHVPVGVMVSVAHRRLRVKRLLLPKLSGKLWVRSVRHRSRERTSTAGLWF